MSVLLSFIRILCELFTIAIIIRAILSWFSPSPTNRLVIILHQLTELILGPLRRIIPRAGLIDFTPLVAIRLLQLIVRLTYMLS